MDHRWTKRATLGRFGAPDLGLFGGMEAKQISEVLQVSEKTVLRDWNFARLWLSRELRKDAA